MAKMLRNKLKPWQKNAAKFAYKEKKAALFMRPGTGKTITSLAVAARVHKRHGINVLIVVCPKKVISVWERQIPQHLNLDYAIFKNLKQLEKARNNPKAVAPGIPQLNILTLSYGQIYGLRKQIINLNPKFLIFDESHEVKESKNKSSKACAEISVNAEYCLIMSGTPRGNDDLDLYGQYNVMDCTLFGNWWQFEKRYTRKFGYDFRKRELRPAMKSQFMEIIKSRAIYVSERRALPHLPKPSEEIRYIQLTGHALEHYKSFESKCATTFMGMTIKEDLAVSNLVRLQQLCGGFLKVENDIIQLEQDKLKDLLDFIHHEWDWKEKIVIFAKYIEEIHIIAKALSKLSINYGILYGKSKNPNIWHDFQDKPDMQIIICQIKTGGVGIDLFASSLCIFYSNSYSYIQFDQAVKRLDRMGQRKKVRIIHLIVKDSIDEDLLSVLKRKGKKAKDVLKQLNQRRLKWVNH